MSDPANCTPTGVYSLMNDPARFIANLEAIRNLDTGIEDDLLGRAS